MNGSAAWATTFNTVSVELACRPRDAWDVFLDRAAWQPSFISRAMVDGTDGWVGSRAVVRSLTDTGPSERFEQNIHVEPERRVVVRIWAAWTTIVTHADFAFEPLGSGCRVSASIHCWLPTEAAAGADHLQSLTQAKIDDDFQRLKAVAERRAYTP